MSRIFQYQGVLTALSSVSHIGETRGIYSFLRREKVINAKGSGFEEIPIITGNSLRGRLRDLGMLQMCRALGYGIEEKEDGEFKIAGLPLPAFYFLFSGGSLTKEGGKALDIDKAREFRKLIPLIALFGSAVGNMILDGKLLVGKLIPICTETAHLLPEHLVEKFYGVETGFSYHLNAPLTKELLAMAFFGETGRENLVLDFENNGDRINFSFKAEEQEQEIPMSMPEDAIAKKLFDLGQTDLVKKQIVQFSKNLLSVWNMIQLEPYTRKDDEKNESLRLLIDSQERKQLEAKAADKRLKQQAREYVDTEIGKHQQMRYHVETFAMGTRFFAEFTLKDPTNLEYEAFMVTLAEFARLPYIGGMSAKGHGKVKMQFDSWLEINPNISLNGVEVTRPIGVEYQQHIESNGAAIKNILAEIK